MMPNDNQSNWDPRVLEYLEKKKQAAAAEQAARDQANTTETVGLGADLLGAALMPSKAGAVLFNHYNDTSAPKVVGGSGEAKLYGEGLRASAAQQRAAAPKAGEKVMGDFFEQEKVQDMSTQRTRQADADARNAETHGWAQGDQERKQEMLGLEDDPTSANSRIAQGLAKKLLPSEDFSGMNATQINQLFPHLKTVYSADQEKLWRQMQLQDRNSARQESQDARSAQVAEKHNEKVEKKVSDLSEKAEPVKQVLDAVGQFEALLPNKSLDKYDPEKDDLPGVSVMGLGRVSAYSPEARQLSGAMSKVFNTELKDRSGASVSNQELERLKSEFAAGKYNSEEEMIGAMKRYKATAMAELERREKAYPEEVRSKYKDFGNSTSADYAKPGSTTKAPTHGADLP